MYLNACVLGILPGDQAAVQAIHGALQHMGQRLQQVQDSKARLDLHNQQQRSRTRLQFKVRTGPAPNPHSRLRSRPA
jgi:hypothetical protein